MNAKTINLREKKNCTVLKIYSSSEESTIFFNIRNDYWNLDEKLLIKCF